MSNNPNSRNYFSSTGDPDDISGDGSEVLKIALSPKFVRYFIENAEGTIVFYGDYGLQSISGEDELAGQLDNILSKDSFLSRKFKQVRVCWSTDFEIIPTVFFDKNELSSNTACNAIMGGEANFVFDLPAALLQVLETKFSGMEHHHSGAAMIETLHRQGLAAADRLFVHINADNVEIACFEDSGALRIYNRYEYKAWQDYIYFVLLVADEMRMDREKAKAILMGEVSRDSQLYEGTYRYFMNVAFISRPEGRHFSKAFDNYPAHFNYPLYNL